MHKATPKSSASIASAAARQVTSALQTLVLVFSSAALQAGTPEPVPGWVRLPGTDLDSVYLREQVDFSAYHRIIIDPLSVWHTSPSPEGREPHTQQLRDRFTTAFDQRFKRLGFDVVQHARENTLRLHAELIDLKINETTVDSRDLAKRFRFAVAAGRMTLVAELQDARTGKVLLRIADLEESNDSVGTLWAEVESALAGWSDSLAATIVSLGSSPDTRVARVNR